LVHRQIDVAGGPVDAAPLGRHKLIVT
jgi:hypothetical protein